MSAVKTWNARSRSTSTTTSRRTASTVSIIVPTLVSCPVLKGSQGALPEAVEMCAQRGHALRVDLVQAARPLLPVEHQADVLEHLEVLRDRRPGDGQQVGELADRQRPVRQPLQ